MLHKYLTNSFVYKSTLTAITALMFVVFMFASCSGGKTPTVQPLTSEEKQEADVFPLMNIYLDILKSNQTFYLINRHFIHDSGNDGKEGKFVLLSEWLDESNLEIVQFTIIDLDGNGVLEVIIELSFHGDRIVFYDAGGKIYAAEFPFRGMTEIKKDGTFSGSSGAASGSIAKLQFTNGITEILLGYSDIIYENNESYEVYCINNEKVSEETYSIFLKKNFEKEDADWYSYSKDTFESDFTKAWKIIDNSKK